MGNLGIIGLIGMFAGFLLFLGTAITEEIFRKDLYLSKLFCYISEWLLAVGVILFVVDGFMGLIAQGG